ncbi:cyclic lactone autoinducer peptide [Halobacillus litoralis]|nr:cyclic lactone autoinducer peptide [Halobacillus litoralis]
MKKIVTRMIAIISLKAKSFSSVASCFWFAYEPDLPEEDEKE